MTLTAKVPTKNGSRYLQQLCKHWSHKFETDFDAQKGVIAFPMGPICMTAGEEALTVTIWLARDRRLEIAADIPAVAAAGRRI